MAQDDSAGAGSILLAFILGAVSGAVQTMRMLGQAAAGALMGALLNAIGSDPDHLRLSITAIFSLAALLALWPATFGRPMVGERLASE